MAAAGGDEKVLEADLTIACTDCGHKSRICGSTRDKVGDLLMTSKGERCKECCSRGAEVQKVEVVRLASSPTTSDSDFEPWVSEEE